MLSVPGCAALTQAQEGVHERPITERHNNMAQKKRGQT